MFQRIVVPLDGSPEAERSIPVAAGLARQVAGRLLFFHIVTPAVVLKKMGVAARIATGAGSYEPESEIRHTEVIEAVVTEAASYLAELPARYADELAGVTCETEVAFGITPPTFPSSVRPEKADLMVLCHRREAGLGNWGLASIVQPMMRQSPLPLLILNEHAPEMPVLDGTRAVRLLVPLDGSLFAETALEPAVRLLAQSAGTGKRELCLVHVVDLFAGEGSGTEETHTNPYVVAQARQSALRYLQAVAQRMRGKIGGAALQITCRATSGVDIARAILDLQGSEAGEKPPVTLIALATHGREGLPRQAMGSIAERLLRASTTPLLTVCPQTTSMRLLNVALPAESNN